MCKPRCKGCTGMHKVLATWYMMRRMPALSVVDQAREGVSDNPSNYMAGQASAPVRMVSQYVK